MSRLGKWLCEQRTGKGWSQVEVSKKTGLSSFTVSTAENGRVSLNTLQKLCELYGASLEVAKRLHADDLKSPPGDTPAQEESVSEPDVDETDPEEPEASEDQDDSEDSDATESDPELSDVMDEIKNTLLWIDGLRKYGKVQLCCCLNVAGARLDLQYREENNEQSEGGL